MSLNLDSHIAALLNDHDCVILPDFGGFVANYAPAQINKVNHRFDPPMRKISFNKLLVHNDGLLAAYVAQKENQRYEDAIKQVRQYALYLKSEIRTNKKIRLEKVGILMLQPDGTYRFEQLPNPELYLEGFGLKSFFGQPIESRTHKNIAEEPKSQRITHIPQEPEPQEEDMKGEETPAPKVIPIVSAPTPEKAKSKKRYYRMAAAAAVAFPLVGYAVWVALSTPLLNTEHLLQASDLNPFRTKGAPAYEERGHAFSFTDDAIDQPTSDEPATGEYMVITLGNDPDKTLVVRLTDPVGAKMSEDLANKFHVMGGCFGMPENAHRLVSNYKSRGKNASIIDEKGGLYRVSVASYATRKEAEMALASFQGEIPGAWILYK